MKKWLKNKTIITKIHLNTTIWNQILFHKYHNFFGCNYTGKKRFLVIKHQRIIKKNKKTKQSIQKRYLIWCLLITGDFKGRGILILESIWLHNNLCSAGWVINNFLSIFPREEKLISRHIKSVLYILLILTTHNTQTKGYKTVT